MWLLLMLAGPVRAQGPEPESDEPPGPTIEELGAMFAKLDDGTWEPWPLRSITDLQIRKRRNAEFPTEARSFSGHHVCHVMVWIRRSGKPSRVVTTACPEVFHPEVERTFLWHRWERMDEPARVILNQVFRL